MDSGRVTGSSTELLEGVCESDDSASDELTSEEPQPDKTAVALNEKAKKKRPFLNKTLTPIPFSPVNIYLSNMAEEINNLIKKISPFLEEKTEVFRELSVFFGEGATPETNRKDLLAFLGRKRLFRVIRIAGSSFKDCVYQLVDNYPESMETLGMLRYYKSPSAQIPWEEIEKAEIALGNELTANAYGWTPDAWTAFPNRDPIVDNDNPYGLVAILAFDYGD